uniref:Macaca fascicularis brain cDNA, clone: QflA-22510 n=1 Tax=Macaca fascicularis TaxID=9541 RepID=I7GMJ2_MACFA|nr:unnamed protein product [Macaca fascicularis]
MSNLPFLTNTSYSFISCFSTSPLYQLFDPILVTQLESLVYHCNHPLHKCSTLFPSLILPYIY